MTVPVRGAIRMLRIDQWAKNAFVFAGVLFTGRLADPASLRAAAGAFLAFSLVASAGYVHNDVLDRDADGRHPRKRFRPLPAGEITIGAARVLQVVLLLVGLALAFWIDRRVGVVVAAYALLTAAYSLWLKHAVVLDVLAIAVGFVLRVVAGCAAIHVSPSKWIVLCTLMLALFLGLGKRRHEASLLGARGAEHRLVLTRYSLPFLDQLISIVSALTVMCYIMFTMWPETVARHGTTDLVYTVPLVMYGLFRYVALVYQEDGGADPTSTLLTDRHLLAAIALWAVVVVAILGTEPTGEPWGLGG